MHSNHYIQIFKMHTSFLIVNILLYNFYYRNINNRTILYSIAMHFLICIFPITLLPADFD